MSDWNCVCQACGLFYRVSSYRVAKSKYCGRRCKSSAVAKAHLNKGPKPWAAANLDGHRHKSRSCFKVGQMPWNKGAKGYRASPETEFQKGRGNERKMPFGSVTIRSDKNGRPRAWVKSTDGWKPRAQMVWLAVHGGIPPGHVLHHKDGDSLNDRLENLEPLTPAQHARAHHAS